MVCNDQMISPISVYVFFQSSWTLEMWEIKALACLGHISGLLIKNSVNILIE